MGSAGSVLVFVNRDSDCPRAAILASSSGRLSFVKTRNTLFVNYTRHFSSLQQKTRGKRNLLPVVKFLECQTP